MINILNFFVSLILISLTISPGQTEPGPPPPPPPPSFIDRNYSWQDFNGTIPENALIGGYDSDDKVFFIGQTYQPSAGNSIGPIYPDVPHINIPVKNEVVQINSSIKILCGQDPPAAWIRANAEHLHVNLIDKQPVIGGKTNLGEYIFVGRIFYENKIQIGLIKAFQLNQALLYFVHEDHIYSTPVYEVLLYESHERERKHRQRPRKPGRWHH